MENKKLTPKQQRFCEEYLANGMNATLACVSAGYSEKTATEQGSRLLTNVNIKAFLDTKKEKTATKLEITKESLIQVLMDITKHPKAKDNDKINSVKVISQMLGYNAATKIDNKHTLNTSLKDLMGFEED